MQVYKKEDSINKRKNRDLTSGLLVVFYQTIYFLESIT